MLRQNSEKKSTIIFSQHNGESMVLYIAIPCCSITVPPRLSWLPYLLFYSFIGMKYQIVLKKNDMFPYCSLKTVLQCYIEGLEMY